MMAATAGPTGIIFDLDGTLIATRRLYLESFADALEPVLGRRPTHDEMMELRPRAERRFLEEVGGREAHAGVMERFYASYRDRHPHDFEGVYDGVPLMLEGLRRTALPLGIVTGKSRRSWAITEPHAGLGAFQVSVFDEDVPAAKPDPSGLRLALERLGLTPERVIYVGDSSTDLEAARAAGMRPGAVLWSKRESERDAFARLAEKVGAQVFQTPAEVTGSV